MSKTKPRLADIKLTLNTAAKALNTDRRTLGRRLEACGITTGRGQQFTLAELFRAIAGEYSRSRTRVAVATAERIEAENAKRKGELIDCASVKTAIHHHQALYWSQMDRYFLDELPPELAGLSDPFAVRAKCKEAIEKLKAGLRAGFEAMIAGGNRS